MSLQRWHWFFLKAGQVSRSVSFSLALEAQNEAQDLHVFSNACAGFVCNLSIVISVFSDEVIYCHISPKLTWEWHLAPG